MSHIMIEHWTEYTRFFIALLVILDPFFIIPIFLSLTAGYSAKERATAARTTSLTVMTVLIITAMIGETLLIWMGTSLGSFRVGGGIVLFLMALAMLKAQTDQVRTTESEQLSAESRETVAVVPLAIPLLAGPGAMSTVIIAMQRSTTAAHPFFVLACIVAVSLLVWLVLVYSPLIEKRLGPIGLNIMNRIFGLILVAIAVEVITNGIKQLFPVLTAS